MNAIGPNSNVDNKKTVPSQQKNAMTDAPKLHLANVTIRLKNVQSANQDQMIQIVNIQWITVKSLNLLDNAKERHLLEFQEA